MNYQKSPTSLICGPPETASRTPKGPRFPVLAPLFYGIKYPITNSLRLHENQNSKKQNLPGETVGSLEEKMDNLKQDQHFKASCY